MPKQIGKENTTPAEHYAIFKMKKKAGEQLVLPMI